jgi:UDP-N-acetylmuramyl pentapeptide phosphotransferase/UDP-N-acetylglucosamine-1-phosphate transferase
VSLRLAGHLSASAAMCVGTLDAGPVLLAALIASTAWMINLYNFMDGSDGLAGGMAVFGFGTYAGVAWLANDAMLATACASVAAAALAFLRFNFHPARVFMGDVGSIPIGFLVAGLGLTGAHRGDWPLWFPAVVFAPFLVDASWTLLRRVANGEKVWQAHRNHYYQRLVRLGWGHRRTAVAEYGLMAISGVAAVAALFAPPMPRVAIFVALGLLYAGAMWAVDRRWSAFSGTDPR